MQSNQRGTLLDQWNLVRVAAQEKRLSRGDIAVFIEVTNNYYRRYGNSRASFTFLAAATGLSRRTVINSIQRLRKYGYLELARVGSGKRPSEYAPNWSTGDRFRPSSGDEASLTAETNSASPPSAPVVNTCALKPAYVPGSQAGLRKQGQDSLRGGLPPGLCGPATARARDSFNKLWNAYGVKFERAKAKSEFFSLDSDDDLLAELVTAASHWNAEYERQGRPKEYRKRLHNWIIGECWLEDGPEPYFDRPAKRAAKQKKSKSRGSSLPPPSFVKRRKLISGRSR